MHRGAGAALALFVWTATAAAEELPAALQPGADEALTLRVRVLRYGPAYLAAGAARPMPMSAPTERIDSDSEVTLPALAQSPSSAPIESSVEFGDASHDYELHYSLVPSTFLGDDTAAALGITRATDLCLRFWIRDSPFVSGGRAGLRGSRASP